MNRNHRHSSACSLHFARPSQIKPARSFVIFSWILVAFLAILIFYISSRSGDSLSHGTGIITLVRNLLIDVSVALFGHPIDVSPVGHFTEFFFLGLLLANALRCSLPLRRAYILAVVLASLYGVTDEIHQIFVAGRSCDPLDWLVDTIAALLGALLFSAFLHARRKRKDSRARIA